MNGKPIRKVIIVGGGTAGWMSAALLMKVLGKSLEITLVESDRLGTVGVGEATIPPIVDFNNALGINEGDFLKATGGTINLGIQFENWGREGDSYMHAFGVVGKDFPFCSFHHFWVKSRLEGMDSSFWDFSLNFQAATGNKYARLKQIKEANLPGLSHAYHFDASLYAACLRRLAESLGVQRREGLVKRVQLEPESGFVAKLLLEDGAELAGDLFLDCSGFRGLLIERELHTGYEDWTRWLPCDRALALPSAPSGRLRPYTQAKARRAGWQWRIPLRHRVGNGLVYSSRHLSEDEATQLLLRNLDGEPLDEPRSIPFRTGRRLKPWHRNVVAVGLAAGFLEPLESTGIHLIQSSVARLLKLFPRGGISGSEADEFNRQSREEMELIRDFIILHYHQNQREDEPFWRECRRMEIPSRLRHRMQLFREAGRVFRTSDELFTEAAWQQVLIGQNLVPEDYHPLAGAISSGQLKDMLDNLKIIISGTVERLGTHEQYLKSATEQAG